MILSRLRQNINTSVSLSDKIIDYFMPIKQAFMRSLICTLYSHEFDLMQLSYQQIMFCRIPAKNHNTSVIIWHHLCYQDIETYRSASHPILNCYLYNIPTYNRKEIKLFSTKYRVYEIFFYICVFLFIALLTIFDRITLSEFVTISKSQLSLVLTLIYLMFTVDEQSTKDYYITQ